MKFLIAILFIIPNSSWGLELFCKMKSNHIYSTENIEDVVTLDLYTEHVNEFDIFVKIDKEQNYIQYKSADSKEYVDIKFDLLINDDFYFSSEEAFKDNPSKSNVKDTGLIKINRKTGFMTWGYNSEYSGANKKEFFCEKSEVKF